MQLHTNQEYVWCNQIGHYGAHARTEHCTTVQPAARPYTDHTGRTQYAVDGPAGTFLVTRDTTRRAHENWDSWQVWRSDSLDTVFRHQLVGRAIERAWSLAHRTRPAPVFGPDSWAPYRYDSDGNEVSSTGSMPFA